MIFYEFPEINTIDDVLPHIKDCDQFRVVDKGDYTVINYVVMGNETFPAIESHSDKIKRECRGLIFDKGGKLINRRFHKFFNFGEREECLPENVDLTKPHAIFEKLDGSMVSPCYVDGKLRWMTKMGITDTSLQAEDWVKNKPNYIAFAIECLDNNHTPIFEWCSNKNRIVLDYPIDRLVLTAIRDTSSGVYHSLIVMCLESGDYDIDIAKTFYYDVKNITEIVRQQEGVEGVVIRFENGHMLKVKAESYIRIHRVKALLERERDVVACILNNELDDILPILNEEHQKKIKYFEKHFLTEVLLSAQFISDYVRGAKRLYKSKKEYALSESSANAASYFNRWVFKFFDEDFEDIHIIDEMYEQIKKHCSSNTRYDMVKSMYFEGVKLDGGEPTED